MGYGALHYLHVFYFLRYLVPFIRELIAALYIKFEPIMAI